METKVSDILDEVIPHLPKGGRRKLLPWWMKIFIWLFFILAGGAFVALVLGLLGFTCQLSIYGIETLHPISLEGLIIISIALLKGATSWGLWMEKDWAIRCGFVDAILGIFICTYLMIILPWIKNGVFSFKLELVFLVPYLIKLRAINPLWKSAQ
jgi:hypothetical protein